MFLTLEQWIQYLKNKQAEKIQQINDKSDSLADVKCLLDRYCVDDDRDGYEEWEVD